MAVIAAGEISAGIRLASGLPRFLHRQPSTPEARRVLQGRFENRRPDFLSLVRRTIYDHPGSPYKALLRRAGCEIGDLAKLVAANGIEDALRALLREGVYLMLEEFKGRQPVVRGTASFPSEPGALRNPLAQPGWSARSSGTSGRATAVTFGLDFVRERAANLRLFLEARGGIGWRHAIWGVPGSTDLIMLLELAGAGLRPERWFSQIRPGAPGLHPKYLWSAKALGWASRWAGKPLPKPVDAPLDDPRPVVRWLRSVLDAGQVPHLTTFVTPAIRMCRAARAEGVDISGTQLTLGGEPLTEARLEMLRLAGAVAVPRFLAIESGYIGYGCLRPAASDDNHLIHDFNAVIAAGPDGPARGLPERAILLTSVRPSVPVIMLNVSLGDEADLGRRSCGCPLDGLGYETHISGIRSYERLKSGGMTFADADVVPILERALPGRFGGTALDYQLVERERADGTPEIVIVVSPSVGPLAPEDVVGAFLEAVGRGSGAERVASLQWRSGRTIRCERREPEKTATGKIKHLLRSRP
jgi:hypothetical protein